MITKEMKTAFFKSQAALFMSTLATKGDGGTAGGFKGLCVRDLDDTAHIIGIVMSGGRPYGVNTTVSCVGDDTNDPTGEERILSGCLTDEETKNGINALMDITGSACVERLTEFFAERYLTTKVNGQAILSPTEITKLSQAIAPALRKTLDAILTSSNVDIEAVKIVSGGTAHEASYKSYAFYSIKDETLRLLRHQAASSYPALANMMADVISIRQTIDNRDPLQPALIASDPDVLSKPILKKLAGNRLGIDRDTLCALSQVPPDWFPKTQKEMDYAKAIVGNFLILTQGDPVRLLKPSSGRFEAYAHTLLSAYADTRPPEGATEHDMAYLHKAIDFSAFDALKKSGDRKTICEMADAVSQSIPPAPNVPPDALAGYIKRRYAADVSLQAMSECRSGVEHLLDLMVSRVSMPLVAHLSGLKQPPVNYELFNVSRNMAEELLLQQKSPVVILEHFRHLHNMLGLLQSGGPNALNGALEELNEQKEEERIQSLGGYILTKEDKATLSRYHGSTGRQEWPTFFAPFEVGNVAIVPLLSKEDLSHESDVMQNCCSDYYAVKSKTLTSLLFSIRKRDGDNVENLATFELNPEKTSGMAFSDIRIGACLGFGNSPKIPLDAKNIIVRFWEERVQPYRTLLRNARNNKDMEMSIINAHSAPERKGIDLLIDYNWRSDVQLERAMEPWTPYISKRYRVSIDKIKEMPFVKDAVDTINPLLKTMKSLSVA